MVGASLLSVFRITLGDDGRFMWLEPDIAMMAPNAPPGQPQGAAPTLPEPLAPDAPTGKGSKNPEKKPATKPATKPAAGAPAPAPSPGAKK